MAEIVCRRNRKLVSIIQAWVIKCALAVHFQISHKGVPMCYRTPACPGMQVNAGQTKGRRYECGCRSPVWTERLAIQNEFGVKFARPPREKNLFYRGHIDPQ